MLQERSSCQAIFDFCPLPDSGAGLFGASRGDRNERTGRLPRWTIKAAAFLYLGHALELLRGKGVEAYHEEGSSEKQGTITSHTSKFDSANLTPAAAKKVFADKLGLRLGKEPHGGAGYCLSDVYQDNAKDNKILFVSLQTKMAANSAHPGWAPWKLRLWNACAFGLSLTKEEGGFAFLIANITPLVSGQRYAPEADNSRLGPVWKTMDGAKATFVKVNLVLKGVVELARIEYVTGEPTEQNVDKLYGEVIEKLNEKAG